MSRSRIYLPVCKCDVWLLSAVLVLGGCANNRIKADDLRSEVQHAQQLARECSQLIELSQRGRVTENFRRTHELYLLKQSEELEKNIRNKSPDASVQQAFSAYKERLALLMDSVRKLESDPQKQSFDSLERDLRQLEKQL